MRRWLKWLGVAALAAALSAWLLSAPKSIDPAAMDGLTGDPEHGALVFHASGCASCHSAPGASGEGLLVLAGGRRFASPFGTFIAPNISPDEEHGIGLWSPWEFANALKQGVSPDQTHYFPAFPYTSFTRMTFEDIADLHAYMATLPPDDTASLPHEVAFPFNIRRTMGLWKLLFFQAKTPVDTSSATPEVQRGAYLAEALGHCAECHTPRNLLGGLQLSKWLGGGPMPDGKGTVPNITPGGIDWSLDEIVAFLTTGFTPDFDVVGGEMALVVDELARLPESDRWAIAEYLRFVPPVATTPAAVP